MTLPSPLRSLPTDPTDSQGLCSLGGISGLSIQAFLPDAGPRGGRCYGGCQEERLCTEEAGRWPRPHPATGQLNGRQTVVKKKKQMNVFSKTAGCFTCLVTSGNDGRLQ